MRKVIVILGSLVVLLSCTKTISPKLNVASPQIIIQGVVSDTAGPYFISITSSVGFYNSNTYPGVSGASITITDSTSGVSDSLTETTSGIYMTHSILQGLSGHTYLLSVFLAGKTYRSSSTMPQPVVLDSVSFDVTDKKRIRAQANYKDPAGVVNFYKYSLSLNGKPDFRFQTFEDRLSDGRYIQDKLDSDTGEIKKNDFVKLSLVCIDKNVYTYLSESEAVAYSNDIQSAPANATSNVSGGCLGFFSAQTVNNKTGVVK